MSELDLSFVGKKEDVDPVAVAGNTSGLDLSFMGKVEAGAENIQPNEVAEQIISDRSSGLFPQKAEGKADKFLDFFTGNERETKATDELPEFGSEIGLKSLLGGEGSFSDAATLLTTTNPAEMVKIIQGITSKPVSIRADEAGNVIIGVEGREAVLNKPGLSKVDLLQLGGLGAAFFPSSKVAAGAATIKGAVVKGGATAAATQTGIEGVQKIKGGDVDPGDIAVAGIAGGASEVALPALQSLGRFVKQKISGSTITPQMIKESKEFALSAGLDPKFVASLDARALLNFSKNADDAVQGAPNEFGLNLTKGQESLNPAQLSLEDRLRSGALGDKPQNTMLDFERNQTQQLSAARDQVAESLGGVQTTRQQAGATVKQGIQNAEDEAAQIVSQAYDAVGEAAITPDGVSNILKATRQTMRGIEFDKTLPQTQNLLGQIKSFESTIKTFKDKGLRPIDIKRIEQMRKRINTAASAADNPSDLRQVTIMKRAFDDGIDQAIDDVLYSGDEAAISSLKQARGIFSEYAKKFRANPTKTKSGRNIADKPGEFIERVIADNPTDEQVVNALLGASNINNSSGTLMARRFKSVLGEDSEGWQAVRQEGFRRIIKTNKVNGEEIISAQQTLKAFDDAVDKSGSLMRELYSPAELSLMRRFILQAKRTQPDLVRSRENPSGTGQFAAKSVSDAINKLSTALALSGDLSLAITAKGISTGKGFKTSSQAKDAIRPFSSFQPAAALPASVIVGGASSASQADVLPSNR